MSEETQTESLIAEFDGQVVIHDVMGLPEHIVWMGKVYRSLDGSDFHYDQVELFDGTIVGVELQFMEGDHNVDRVCAAMPNWSLRTGDCRVRIDFVSPFERARIECVQGFGALWECEQDRQVIVGILRFEGYRFSGSIPSGVKQLA